MRRPEGDYAAISAALRPHQLQTLLEYAHARGMDEHTMWTHPVCCVIAATLAVNSVIEDALAEGTSIRHALMRAASQFDLDYETLLRRQRHARDSTSPD